MILGVDWECLYWHISLAWMISQLKELIQFDFHVILQLTRNYIILQLTLDGRHISERAVGEALQIYGVPIYQSMTSLYWSGGAKVRKLNQEFDNGVIEN